MTRLGKVATSAAGELCHLPHEGQEKHPLGHEVGREEDHHQAAPEGHLHVGEGVGREGDGDDADQHRGDEGPVLSGLASVRLEPRLEADRVGDDPDDEDEGRRQEQRRQQAALRRARQPLTAPAVIPATKYSTKNE
jgi:hypothetical protein